MTTPETQAVPVAEISLVAGVPKFLTLSEIYAVPGIDMFEVTCLTDGNCTLMLSWERTNPPANPGEFPVRGTVSDVGPTMRHRLAVPDDTIAVSPRQGTPQEVRYEISLDPTDSSGRTLRPYIGTLKLRQTPTNFVPVKFYEFGGTPPPTPGGDEGDWNTYTWAQYNPNGTERVDIDLPFLDITARNGGPPFGEIPAIRVFVRAGITGTVGIEFSTPLADMANSIPEVPFPHRTALLHVFHNGAIVERFAWRIPEPGELEPIEAFIRGVADSHVIRPARLINNPGSDRPSFLGPNYWLVSTAGAQPSALLMEKDQKPMKVQKNVA